MSSLPKIGALDRQAGVPRVSLRFSTTRNPASIRFELSYTRRVNLASAFGVLNRNVSNITFILLCCACGLNLRNHCLPSLIGIQDRDCIAHSVSKHIF